MRSRVAIRDQFIRPIRHFLSTLCVTFSPAALLSQYRGLLIVQTHMKGRYSGAICGTTMGCGVHVGGGGDAAIAADLRACGIKLSATLHVCWGSRLAPVASSTSD